MKLNPLILAAALGIPRLGAAEPATTPTPPPTPATQNQSELVTLMSELKGLLQDLKATAAELKASAAKPFPITWQIAGKEDDDQKEAEAGPDPDSDQPSGPVTFLGIATTPISAELGNHLGLEPQIGLSVQQVVPDSPAAKAGLTTKDLLMRLDDQILVSDDQLRVLIRRLKPGITVNLGVIRQGKPETIKAILGARAQATQVIQSEKIFSPRFSNPMVQWAGAKCVVNDMKVEIWDGVATITDAAGKEVYKGPADLSKMALVLPADALSLVKSLLPKLAVSAAPTTSPLP